MGGSSFGISHGEVSFGLAAQGVGSAPWSAYTNGVDRPAPFGLETVTAGRTKVEQFLTVGRHVGKTTWRWKFVGLPSNLTPRVGADGYVAFLVGTGVVKRLSQDAFIAPPAILDAKGHRIPEKNLHWSVSTAEGSRWLNLRVNDSKLPTPYVIDPIAERGTSGTNTNNGGSLSLTTPTGATTGDVLIGHVAADGGSGTTITKPSVSWNQIYSNSTGATSSDIHVEADYLVLAAAPAASYSWSFSPNAKISGGLSAFSGVNTANPLTTSGTSSAGNVQATAGTGPTTGAITWNKNDAVVALFATTATATLSALPTSFTELYGKTTGVNTSTSSVAAGFLVEGSAQGSATSFSGTWGGSGKMISVAVALNGSCNPSCSWTGAGADNNWSTAGNWTGSRAPAPDGSATLTFPSGASRLSNNNDLAAGSTIVGITLSGSGYTLAGNQVTLGAGGISDTTSTSLGTNTISLPLTATASRTVSVTTAGETVALSGIYSGTGGSITKSGSGALTLSGANTFNSGVSLTAGTLNINNATALGSGTLTIAAGATIDNTSGNPITESNNNAQTWNGNFTFTGSNNLNLGTGAVAGGNATRTVTVSGGNLTLGGAITITGASGLTKAGNGTLTLGGANSWSNGVTLNAGQLNVNNAAALGSGTFTIANGTTIDNTSGSGLTNSGNNAQAWSGDFTFAGSNDLNLGTGGVTLQTATRTVTVSGGNLTVGGIITDGASTFGLTKAGSGTLTLTGANTYDGATTINGGILNANSSSALGSAVAGNNLVLNNGTLQASGTITTTRLGTLTNTGTIDTNGQSVSMSGVISGTGGLTKIGAGTLTLSGLNTYTGTTTISNGTLSAGIVVVSGGSSNLGNATSAVTLGDASNTGTLLYTGSAASYTRGFTVNAGGGTLSNSTANSLTVATGGVSTAGNFTVTGTAGTIISSVISGAGSVTKTGSGLLTLSGTNTYSGSTTISAGTLNANASGALGNESGTNTLIFNGGTLQAGGGISSPSGRTVTLSSTGLIDTNGQSVSIAGVISGSGIGLTKSGSGALTLSGNNTYSGTTTVSAGTLTVNGAQSSSAVSLNGGTLNGTGTTGAVTSTASGSTLSPGAPAPGILNSGNVNLSSGSPTFSVALNGTTVGTQYSQLNVTGTVNLTGATLSASLGYTPTNGDSYTLINNDGADAVTGTFSGLSEGDGVVIGGKSFAISYAGGTGNDVVLTAGGAKKLAITSVPATATSNTNFSVTVQSQDNNGHCVQVNSNTNISLALASGTGTLSGNTGTILAGTCSVTLSSVQIDRGGEQTITLTASRTSGDSLTTSAASSGTLVSSPPTAVTFSGASQTTADVTTWTEQFTASNGGALAAGNTVTVRFDPAFSGNIPASPTVTLGGSFSGTCSAPGASTAGAVVTVTLPAGCSLANSATGAVAIAGITNPAAATYTASNFKIHTSFDTIDASPAANIVITARCTSCTWTGAGANNNWSTGANWSGGNAPATDGSATLTFPNGASRLSNTNDFTAGTGFTGIVISGSGYTLAGNQVTLGSSGISDTTTSGSSTISLPLTSGAVRTVSVTNAAETLTLSGVYSGSGGGITKSGSGVLALSGSNTYSGNTTISAGTLNANASAALGSASNTLVFSGGTLQAGGTITSPSTRAVTLSSTGTIDTNGNPVSIAGVISGSGTGLTKSGSGTLTLTGTNTYSGATTISAGTLNANTSAAIGDGSATNTLTFAGGTLQAAGTITSPSTRPVSVASASGTIDTNGNTVLIAGVISGTNGLTKNGSGALTLSGANTFQGGLTHNAGTLNINNATALGTGTFTIAGGTTIDNSTGASITESNNNAQSWNGDFTFTGTQSLNLGTGAVAMSASRQVTVSASTLTVGGPISGSGFGLTKAGAGTLTLSGANTYTGSTTISAGTLTASSSSALGDESATNTLVFAGGTLQAGGTITSPSTRTVTLSSPGTINTNGNGVSIAGVISGSNGLTKSGSGTLTLSGTNTYSGSTTISAGTLNANASAALGDESATNTLAFGGGTLQAGGTITSPSTRTVTLSSAGTIDTNGNPVSIAGVISGSNGLTKSGSGTLTLTGTNTYTGSTTISAGTLNANASAAVGNGSATNTLVFSGGTLQAGGTITSPSTRTVTLSSTGTIDTNGNSVSIAGVISGSGTGLTKTGSGTLTLSASNTYSGTTTVSAGTLTVNGSQGSSAVSLNGGTLNGTGTTGAVTSTASGGTVSPGAPAPGILNSGNVNLSSGSPTFSVALNGTTAGSSYSQLNVTGTVNLTGATLSASLGYTPTNGDSYTIVNNDSTDAVTGTFAGLPQGTGLVIGGYSFRISYTGGSGNDVVLIAGGATKLAITSVPANATANVNFSVTVQSQDANGNCIQVNSNTGISLSSDGAGTLSGNTATITAGTCSVTLNSVQDDQGETIHLTASRTSGDSLTTSAASSAIVVANGTFTTNTAVSINGTPKVGVASTLTPGSYTPSHTGTSYQWQLCNGSGLSCNNISGATFSTYTPVAGDVGGTLKVIETITRSGYTNGGSTSAASAVVIKGDFTKTSDVVIDGQPTVGITLTITNSVFSPTVTTRTQQWELCNSGGSGCNPIGGETGTTYTPVAGDVGKTLRIIQTVSRDGYNDGVSTSNATALVIKGDFTTTTKVAIVGTPTVDTASTLTAGSYSPTPASSAYQWQLCDSAGNNCSNIGGATSNTYTPVGTDVGSTLRVVETVSQNGYNDGSSTSDRSALVVKGPITTNTAVAIIGTPMVGVSSTLTAGSYTPSPDARSYQWQRCGVTCADISGATNPTYTPDANDVGKTLKVVETVTKTGYSNGTSTSAASPVVVNGSFSANTQVSITGEPMVDTATTLTPGSYTPGPTSISYQWESCDSSGDTCSNIGGATTGSYTPVPADVGRTLRVIETVSKAGYNDLSTPSDASPVVVEASFFMHLAVAIDGQPTVGTASAIVVGIYTPAPASSSYQWELCDKAGDSCDDISGATTAMYTPVSSQVGSTLRVVETVSRPGYEDFSSTSSAVIVDGVFTTTRTVAIKGTPKVGVASGITSGTYTPTPTARSYQWKRCDSSGNNCVKISGATDKTYTPVAADQGMRLRVQELVRAPLHNGASTSAASAVVARGTFAVHSKVAVFGYPKQGVTSSVTQGSYTPNPTSRTYQWLRCSNTGLSSCVHIAGATSNTYKPVHADVGKRLRVIETVSSAGYTSLSIKSNASTPVKK